MRMPTHEKKGEYEKTNAHSVCTSNEENSLRACVTCSPNTTEHKHTQRTRTTAEYRIKNLTKKKKEKRTKLGCMKGKCSFENKYTVVEIVRRFEHTQAVEAETQTQARIRMSSDRMLTAAETQQIDTHSQIENFQLCTSIRRERLRRHGAARVSEKATAVSVRVVCGADIAAKWKVPEAEQNFLFLSLSVCGIVFLFFACLFWICMNHINEFVDTGHEPYSGAPSVHCLFVGIGRRSTCTCIYVGSLLLIITYLYYCYGFRAL